MAARYRHERVARLLADGAATPGRPRPAGRRSAGESPDPLALELLDALAALPQADREVLFLLAWADLTYEQIAVALDVPVGTVRSRISRARRKLDAVLAAALEDERKALK